MKLYACPMSIKKANEVVKDWHRHAGVKKIARFAIGACFGEELVGVAIAGNPVARYLQDGFTLEIHRVCVTPSAPRGTNSFLYAACWRAWRAMGGRRAVTYTLPGESGASLRGAGWKIIGKTKKHKGWSRPTRVRTNVTNTERKIKWAPLPKEE